MEKYFKNLFGNEEQKRYFINKIDDGSLPHAFIIEGRVGSGRHTLALSIAEYLAKNSPFKDKIFRRESPDIIEYGLSEKKKSIGVDVIRELRTSAYLMPSELDFKMFIVSDADKMTVAAQNAALKVLEEPPNNVYFFLLCENSFALLSTIRSRAQTIRMQPFTNEQLDEILSKNPQYNKIKQTNPEIYYSAIRQSGGFLGAAQDILIKTDNENKITQNAITLFEMITNRAYTDILVYISQIRYQREELIEFIDICKLILRDILSLRQGLPLIFLKTEESAKNLGQRLSNKDLLVLYNVFLSVREALNYNVNIQNAKMSLADKIKDALI